MIRNMELDKVSFSEKEKRLFSFALKAHADSNSLTDEDFFGLREVGVTDKEIVEIVEVMNMGDNIIRFCNIMGIEPDGSNFFL